MQDIELRRNDEVFLDAIGVASIPDPTTAGDFCRRFAQNDVIELMHAVNEARVNVWKQQDDSFLEEAVIDADGTFVITTGECKVGMDITCKGEWGYHPGPNHTKSLHRILLARGSRHSIRRLDVS